MTKGRMITRDQKLNFLKVLDDLHGDDYNACKITEISYGTIRDLIYTYPDRDVSFRTNYLAIINSYDKKLAAVTRKSLFKNVSEGKEISTIFAAKAVLGYTENGKIDPTPKKESGQANIPLEALSPETLKMIQKDIKKFNGMDLTDIQPAEEVDVDDLEYAGQKIKTDSMVAYDPSKDFGQKRRPRLDNGEKRTR